MTVEDVATIAVRPALAMLPERLDSPEARAMLYAIGLQESGLSFRRQMPAGPARGLWQFELVGVRGVLEHPASRDLVRSALLRMAHPVDVGTLHATIEFSDVVAAVLARGLLWTLPERLPRRDEADLGWRQYLAAWRPGRPHPEPWRWRYGLAWDVVTAGEA